MRLHLPSVFLSILPCIITMIDAFQLDRRACISSFATLLAPTIVYAEDGVETAASSIGGCMGSRGSEGTPVNCVSTSSVRQVDLYMPPWTIPDGMSKEEVMARLKGAIRSDPTLSITEETPKYLKVKATRNFSTDELEFLINDVDSVVTFRSQQTDGPSVSDLGANRKRLADIKKKLAFLAMGEEYETADNAPREGALGQLKAFYGFRSGGGFEDIVLDQDE